ncbi:MAG: CDP-diacylglycerol--glycerol-3-phosphate 3-phosphatidyltransferase [Coriobacteriia bacterium]|nr:CDP-diacylglycerol--glycerol-3-phosphate 3-phosphatidyltransferase [Coriobacteriia bacterium]
MMKQRDPSSRRLSWGLGPANTVTLARILLIPFFLIALLSAWPKLFGGSPLLYVLRPWIATAVFAVLAATDAVDGYLARSRGEITTFGKFIDPLADKILITAALLALVEMNVLPSWIALIIIAREFIVSGLRMIASAEGVVIAASWLGKLKTNLQIVAICMFIVKDSRPILNLPHSLPLIFNVASWCVMAAAVLFTIISLVSYFKHALDTLQGPWN